MHDHLDVEKLQQIIEAQRNARQRIAQDHAEKRNHILRVIPGSHTDNHARHKNSRGEAAERKREKRIAQDDEYFKKLSTSWSEALRQAFAKIEEFKV